ncbi:hypothetical protein [Pseudoroseicyclus sp. CXY001]|uniref:hypothetical protein n=1 Tax=Pseudoroseicyclus sp. CXY001 TaxID=3242492 RepID=UPI003570DC61
MAGRMGKGPRSDRATLAALALAAILAALITGCIVGILRHDDLPHWLMILALVALPVALWHHRERLRRFWRGTGVNPRRGRRPGEAGMPQREALEAELAEFARLPAPDTCREGPIPRQIFLANIVRGGLRRCGVRDIARLTDAELVALWVVLRAVTAPEGEAELLFAELTDPAPIRALRQRAAEIAAARARFERERAASAEALAAWRRHGRVSTGPHGLLGFLMDEVEADPVLWHNIATDMDPDDKEQLSAVLWAISQPECNAGTLVALLSALVSTGRLPALVAADNASPGRALQRRIGQAIQRWNGGWGGEPWASVSEIHAPATARSWAAAVKAAEEAIGAPLGWAEPKGLFGVWRHPVEGRGAFSWDAEQGLMSARPEPADYITWREEA